MYETLSFSLSLEKAATCEAIDYEGYQGHNAEGYYFAYGFEYSEHNSIVLEFLSDLIFLLDTIVSYGGSVLDEEHQHVVYCAVQCVSNSVEHTYRK